MTAPLIRIATRDDLPAIVEMLADDNIGASRERFEDPLAGALFEKLHHLNLIRDVDGFAIGECGLRRLRCGGLSLVPFRIRLLSDRDLGLRGFDTSADRLSPAFPLFR